MSDLTIFEHPTFGEVRTLEVDGNPWFVGKDVVERLGYKRTADALKAHVDDEDKGVGDLPTPGGIQQIVIINESGLYSLILRSQLPQAREFKRWITTEVLPSIRRTGAYRAAHAGPSPDTLLRAAELIANCPAENRPYVMQILSGMLPNTPVAEPIQPAEPKKPKQTKAEAARKKAEWAKKNKEYRNAYVNAYRRHRTWEKNGCKGPEPEIPHKTKETDLRYKHHGTTIDII